MRRRDSVPKPRRRLGTVYVTEKEYAWLRRRADRPDPWRSTSIARVVRLLVRQAMEAEEKERGGA